LKVFILILCLLIAVSTTSMSFYPKPMEPITLSFIVEDLVILENTINDYHRVVCLSGYKPNENHFEMIYNKSIEMEVDYLLMFALVAEESSFRQYAINTNKDNSKDFGYFQLNDRWHPQFRNDVEKHIEYGINFFKWCLRVEEDNIERALSRYNSGNPNSRVGLEYARRVLRKKREFENRLNSYTLLR
jgi:soluble lytic murein transglycosylase-like protein